MRKPFKRTNNQTWYVNLGGRHVTLGKDKDEAFRKYHQLMAGHIDLGNDIAASDVIDQFLAWSETHQAKKTYKLAKFFCDSFKLTIKRMKIDDLKPIHVTRWLDIKGYDGSGANTAVRTVLRPFNWAVEMGLIKDHPLKKVKRPAPVARECYLSPEHFSKVEDAIKDQEFHDFVTILRETGCRPQEACAVEARHFDRIGRVWTFPVKESKGKRDQRVVVLNDKAFAITQRLALKNPTGPLFLNKKGRRWNSSNLNCRWRRVSKKVGFKVFSYVLRHTFCTDALLRGVEPMELATLMGHKSIDMIWKIYNKLRLQTKHLQNAMKRATGEAV